MYLSFKIFPAVFFAPITMRVAGYFRSTQIKMYSWDNAQVVLVGNKCDAEDERVISTERGRYLADTLGRERHVM